MLAKIKEMKKSHRVPLVVDQKSRGKYDRSRGRQIVMGVERDESRGEGDEQEIVFDQDTFASKLRQDIDNSRNPWAWFVRFEKAMREKGREAPSTDLSDWLEGKIFFDRMVEDQRAADALIDGAMVEEEWRAIWRDERKEEMRESRRVR